MGSLSCWRGSARRTFWCSWRSSTRATSPAATRWRTTSSTASTSTRSTQTPATHLTSTLSRYNLEKQSCKIKIFYFYNSVDEDKAQLNSIAISLFLNNKIEMLPKVQYALRFLLYLRELAPGDSSGEEKRRSDQPQLL